MQTITALDALAWVGYRVDDLKGARLGSAGAPLVDRETGELLWLRVGFGGTLERYVAVPPANVIVAGGRMTLPQPKSLILRAPRITADGGITPRREREICIFFGVPLTRGAKSAGWERRESTSSLEAPGVWRPAPRGTLADSPTAEEAEATEAPDATEVSVATDATSVADDPRDENPEPAPPAPAPPATPAPSPAAVPVRGRRLTRAPAVSNPIARPRPMAERSTG